MLQGCRSVACGSMPQSCHRCSAAAGPCTKLCFYLYLPAYVGSTPFCRVAGQAMGLAGRLGAAVSPSSPDLPDGEAAASVLEAPEGSTHRHLGSSTTSFMHDDCGTNLWKGGPCMCKG